jgi:hypothetical protein
MPTLALVDNQLRGAEADLLLDQNIGAEEDPVDFRRSAASGWRGWSYAPLRDDVVLRRPSVPRRQHDGVGPP